MQTLRAVLLFTAARGEQHLRRGWSRLSDWFVTRWVDFEGWREDQRRRRRRW
jgi:hypothetical protein